MERFPIAAPDSYAEPIRSLLTAYYAAERDEIAAKMAWERCSATKAEIGGVLSRLGVSVSNPVYTEAVAPVSADSKSEMSLLAAKYVDLIAPHRLGLKPAEIVNAIQAHKPDEPRDPLEHQRVLLEVRKLVAAKILYRSSGGAYRVPKRGVVM